MSEEDPLENTLTIPETSARMRLAEKTIKRMIGDGRLGAYKHGGWWRVPISEIDDYFARRASQAAKLRAERSYAHRPKRKSHRRGQRSDEPQAAAG